MGSERFDRITLLYELHLVFGIAEPSWSYIRANFAPSAEHLRLRRS
jgi:hypothetical protein